MSRAREPAAGAEEPAPERGRFRRRWLLLLAGLLLVADLARPGPEQLSGALLVGAIDGYRAVVSPRMGRFVTCRFTPTCSVYGRAVVARDGALVGAARATWRIARCGPWTPAGTHDPP